MRHFDIFNGDADGICALTQLRNAEPRDSELVTGVKRDIKLVAKVAAAAGDRLTVLDVSLDKNRDGLQAALDAGAEVLYIDHHFAGEIPASDRLTAIIDTAPDVCTSLLVNRHLGGAFALWAVVGAFGDNLDRSAQALAATLGLDEGQRDLLARLGVYVNYNGYGAAIEDLHFPPAELYRLVSRHASPFDFVESNRAAFDKLEHGYREDMAAAAAVQPLQQTDHTAVLVLPDAAWARRVSGVYSNDLANGAPDRAHAVVTEKANGDYLVSVRAPLSRKEGADELCRRFPTGGGRKAAAGINALPRDRLDEFVAEFTAFYTP